MKIAFDAKRLFLNNAGLGNYSRGLVSSLRKNFPENEYVLCTTKTRKNSSTQEFLDSYPIISPQTGFMRSAWRSKGIVKDLKDNSIEIYHGLSHEIPIGLAKANIKSIVTIHDLIYRFFPEDFPWIDRKIYDYKWKYACKNSDLIIATSEATKQDIIKYFSVDGSKIHVVYQTCNSIFEVNHSKEEIQKAIDKYDLPNEFLLYVGAFSKRKNVLELIKSYDSVKDLVKLPLVLVGNGSEQSQIEAFIKKSSLEKKIFVRNNVITEDLPAIYQAAHTFIYPSKYEGFGIPIVEALKSGTQVITSNCSCMPEVGGNAAIYCNPFSKTSISEALVEAVRTNIPAELIKNQAIKFSVEKFASDTMNVYSKF